MKETTKKATDTTAPVISQDLPAYSQISSDLKNSVLIVSVVANLFILTAWIAVQVTAQFDTQVASFLFTR